ncbi:MAG: cell division protein, partial [Bacilli bacterium]|nr:cell division protein [Bacilli bacterium]
MNEQVFALDIGTQSVTGVILLKKGKSFEIIDLYTKHHDERAMLDGQIQNVIEVANIIKDVKEHLEEKHGPLSEVCVAAAGRALKTVRAEASVSLNGQPITKEEEIKHLELSAVQQAQIKLAEESDVKDYHCVGYSVTHYRLDGDIIGSFIDQIGDEASVEVIATFLPKIVVESLIAALERADLKMKALTLEPIAAIHVLMPESMRRLNVGLIDIGAGTSDIAISDEGTIVAYGMVPVAGDEIT